VTANFLGIFAISAIMITVLLVVEGLNKGSLQQRAATLAPVDNHREGHIHVTANFLGIFAISA